MRLPILCITFDELVEKGTEMKERIELDASQIARAQQMANQGKTVSQISKEMHIDYWEVWNHVPGSWQGTKWVITNRLNLLRKEGNDEIRERLIAEVSECVQYLYDRGRQMGRQIERARNTLNE